MTELEKNLQDRLNKAVTIFKEQEKHIAELEELVEKLQSEIKELKTHKQTTVIEPVEVKPTEATVENITPTNITPQNIFNPSQITFSI